MQMLTKYFSRERGRLENNSPSRNHTKETEMDSPSQFITQPYVNSYSSLGVPSFRTATLKPMTLSEFDLVSWATAVLLCPSTRTYFKSPDGTTTGFLVSTQQFQPGTAIFSSEVKFLVETLPTMFRAWKESVQLRPGSFSKTAVAREKCLTESGTCISITVEETSGPPTDDFKKASGLSTSSDLRVIHRQTI